MSNFLDSIEVERDAETFTVEILTWGKPAGTEIDEPPTWRVVRVVEEMESGPVTMDYDADNVCTLTREEEEAIHEEVAAHCTSQAKPQERL